MSEQEKHIEKDVRMNSSQAAQATSNSVPVSFFNQPEYSIYLFERDEFSKGSPVWSKLVSLSSESEACAKAQTIFKTSKFARVEVRCKSVDADGRVVDQAVKILGSGESHARRTALFLCAAAACIVVAGFVTLFG